MTDSKLRTEIWLQIHFRHWNNLNVPAYVISRGDPDLGDVLIKVNYLDGTGCIMQRGYNMLSNCYRWGIVNEGQEAELDSALVRQSQNDGDLWIVELEAKTSQDLLLND